MCGIRARWSHRRVCRCTSIRLRLPAAHLARIGADRGALCPRRTRWNRCSRRRPTRLSCRGATGCSRSPCRSSHGRASSTGANSSCARRHCGSRACPSPLSRRISRQQAPTAPRIQGPGGRSRPHSYFLTARYPPSTFYHFIKRLEARQGTLFGIGP